MSQPVGSSSCKLPIGRGIPVMLTNQRGNKHYATLTAGPSRFGALRLA